MIALCYDTHRLIGAPSHDCVLLGARGHAVVMCLPVLCTILLWQP